MAKISREQVEEVLSELRPALEADGGSIELVDVKDNIVRVRLTGACASCPFATMTLENVVETQLKEKLPEMKKLETVR